MAKKEITIVDNINVALIRFCRTTIPVLVISLAGFLTANQLDMSDWKSYVASAALAVWSGFVTGLSKFLRDQYGIDFKII